MKIIAISDTHADHVTAGVSRYQEVRGVLMAAMARALEVQADLFVHAGDLCDPDSGPIVFECIADAVRVARTLEVHGIQSIWLAGNHCIAETGRGTTVLDPLKALENAGDAIRNLVHVAAEPRIIGVRDDFTDRLAVCLPYPSAAGYIPSSFVKLLAAPAVALTRESGRAGRVIVLAHLVVPGLLPGEESGEMARGKDVMLPDEELVKLAPDIVICGHHHRSQKFRTKAGLDVQVIGAAARFTFGEQDHSPGYLEIAL